MVPENGRPLIRPGQPTNGLRSVAHGEPRPLGVQASHRLNAGQLAALQLLESYDLTRVRDDLLKRYSRASDWADEAIFEFRRFMGLHLVLRPPVAMCSPFVDEVWHCCILRTRLYADLCEQALGTFIDHEPADEAGDLTRAHHERERDLQRAAFRRAYEELYGELSWMWRLQRIWRPASGPARTRVLPNANKLQGGATSADRGAQTKS